MNAFTKDQIDAYERGEIELKELLQLEEVYLEQLRGRAQFFLDGGHHERALMMLEMLAELDRNDDRPALAAAELLLGLGCSDAAAAKIEVVLARRPEQPEALVAMAELEIAGGDFLQAAASLARVLDGDPSGATPAGRRALAVAARAHRQLVD